MDQGNESIISKGNLNEIIASDCCCAWALIKCWWSWWSCEPGAAFYLLKSVCAIIDTLTRTQYCGTERRGKRYTDRSRDWKEQKQKLCCNQTQSSHLGHARRGVKQGEGVIKNTSLSLVFCKAMALKRHGFYCTTVIENIHACGPSHTSKVLFKA